MGIQNTRDPLWMLMSTYGAMQSMVHVRKEEEEEISLTIYTGVRIYDWHSTSRRDWIVTLNYRTAAVSRSLSIAQTSFGWWSCKINIFVTLTLQCHMWSVVGHSYSERMKVWGGAVHVATLWTSNFLMFELWCLFAILHGEDGRLSGI